MHWPSTSLTLTKSLDTVDYVFLQPDLDLVDSFPIGHEQHPHRRWEYAMCIRAIRCWEATIHDAPVRMQAFDVGGAGSTLPTIIAVKLKIPTIVVDPRQGSETTLEELVESGRAHLPNACPVVYSISTIEHTEDIERFVSALARAVLAGGLLFITTDVQKGESVEDDKHFHWMRRRIYSMTAWRELGEKFLHLGFKYFGPPDWRYHGDNVYDYSFASMALVKGVP